MASVVREDIDKLTIGLTVNISKEDYLPTFKQELEKYRKKAHMKGFRKGKTPMGFIKKMYGKDVLADTVQKAIQKEIFEYIEKEKIKYLGQPLPKEGDLLKDFDPNNLIDYSLTFEVGLLDDFTIGGLDKVSVFDKYSVKVPEEEIDENLEGMRKKLGERGAVEEPIIEKDLVKIDATELEGGKEKDGGWATSFSVLIDEHLNPTFSDQLQGKKTGDALMFKVSEIENDRDQEYVRKYFLNVEEADSDTVIGDDFLGTIVEVTRVTEAQMDQVFFDKAFGEGKVTSEDEARGKIKEQIEEYMNQSTDQILYRDVQKALIDKTELELPEAFLKRWVSVTEKKTAEQMEADFPSFKKGLKWTLIRQKLIEKYDLEVQEEEILEGFKNQIRGYFQGYGDELIVLNTANRLMEDRKQVDRMYQEMITDKLFSKLGEEVATKEKLVSKDEFNEVVKKIQEADNSDIAPPAVEAIEVVEEAE